MGNAFLYGNGSGTELAIKIVGGTQRPETGKQGTIWINTDQSITGWTIQSEEPISPAEGMIWINNMTSAKLNALKKNGIWFMPTSAKQYTNGAWTKKTGEYYNNNQWIALFEATIHITYPAGSTCTATDGVTIIPAPDKSGTWDCVVPNAGTWTITAEGYPYPSTVDITTNSQVENVDLTRICLFKDGNQYTDVTGGWTVNGGYTHQLSGSNKPTNGGTATVSDVIYMKASDGKSQSLSHTKMIDVTKYSKIEYAENTTGNVSSIYVTKNRTGNYSSIMLAKINASPGDISGISGEVYFVISTANGRESTFNNIYLVV